MLDRTILALLAVALLATGCRGSDPPSRDLRTRGYILLSIDTLRADHLGAYGYPLDTSPFLDALAARAVLFERCFAQLPGTLPSHMTMLTGLYPMEHGVLPPSGVLDPRIPLLPERLQAAGFRTAGHSEGGYVHGKFGFSRGFGQWSDEAKKIESDIERTLGRGLAFLDGLTAEEPFFLFLHTYVVHDPYFPPAEDLARFWTGPAPDAPPATGPVLSRVNRGELELSPEAVDFYRASYDASIHYADRVLRGFFDQLEARGLLAETTIIVTSDHGEEFQEHGRFAHEQVYPEALRVPLIVLHPDLEPHRVSSLVGLVDLAPTVYDLTGVEPPADLSGTSLVPALVGSLPVDPDTPESAFGQDAFGSQATVVHRGDGEYRQLVTEATDLTRGHGISWLQQDDELVLLEGVDRLAFRAFHEPREIEIEVDGKVIATAEVAPTGWTEVAIEDLPETFPTLRVRSDGCVIPAEVADSNDQRCLGVGFHGLAAKRLELYDLEVDPLASKNLRSQDAEDTRRLLRALLRHRRDLTPQAGSHQGELDPELEERLRSLGYLD